MVKVPSTQRLIAGALGDGKVRSSREIGEITGLPRPALWEGLRRCWVGGLVLRSEHSQYEAERLNLVLGATKLRDLVSFTYLHNMLKCSERGNVLLKTEGLKRPNFIAMETPPGNSSWRGL